MPQYQAGLLGNDPFAGASQNNPQGFDVCIECCDGAQFPSSTELACVQNHIQKLDELWVARWQQETNDTAANNDEIPPRPPPSANHILHLAFPSSPVANQYTLDHILSFVSFLQTLLYPEPPRSSSPSPPALSHGSTTSEGFSGSSFGSSYFSFHRRDDSSGPNRSTKALRTRRKCRVLLFSTDGYTETSVLALCFLMAPKPPHYVAHQPSGLSVFGTSATNSPQLESTNQQRANSAAVAKSIVTSGSHIHGMSLPDAYLELQIACQRSFYVYPADLDLLKRAEARLYQAPRDMSKERGRDREVVARTLSIDNSPAQSATNNEARHHFHHHSSSSSGGGTFSKWKWSTWGSRASFTIPSPPPEEEEAPPETATAATTTTTATMASAGTLILSSSTPNASLISHSVGGRGPRRRARASTSPMPHVWADHWAWFSDPRFDGSFPSRVLPFLYLGNL